MTKISGNAAFQVYLQSLAMCMLQLPLMMLIMTGLKCNSRLILRLLNNLELAQCPHPLLFGAAQTKATLRQLYKCILPYMKKVPAAGRQPASPGWGRIKMGLGPQLVQRKRKLELGGEICG